MVPGEIPGHGVRIVGHETPAPGLLDLGGTTEGRDMRTLDMIDSNDEQIFTLAEDEIDLNIIWSALMGYRAGASRTSKDRDYRRMRAVAMVQQLATAGCDEIVHYTGPEVTE